MYNASFCSLLGSELCSYELPGHKYPQLPERFEKCPKLPVPERYETNSWRTNSPCKAQLFSPLICPLSSGLFYLCSKALPVFNRCTPVDISCYAKFAEAVVTFVSDNSMLNRLIAGVAASKEIIVGLCLLALGKRLLSLAAAAQITFS